MKLKTAVVCLAALFSAATSQAATTQVAIDFTGYSQGSFVSGLQDISFSLSGTLGAPAIHKINVGDDDEPKYITGLSNSATGITPIVIGESSEPLTGLITPRTVTNPAASTLYVDFNGRTASNISFVFNNFGDGGATENYTTVTAFGVNGAMDPVDLSGTWDGDSFEGLKNLSGVTKLAFNNGNSDYWLFSISSLTAQVSAVPEPSSALMFGLGLTALLAARRRKSI